MITKLAQVARAVVGFPTSKEADVGRRLFVVVALLVGQLVAQPKTGADSVFPCARATELRTLGAPGMTKKQHGTAALGGDTRELGDERRDVVSVVFLAAEHPRDVVEDQNVGMFIVELLPQLFELCRDFEPSESLGGEGAVFSIERFDDKHPREIVECNAHVFGDR